MTVYKLLIPAALCITLALAGCATRSAAGTRSTTISDGVAADITVSAADNEVAEGEIAENILGSFSTKYNPKNKNRSGNISRASDAINHHIVQPGEVFSYNETVGPTSKTEGYRLSTIFIKGKMYEGYGGGVCQVSSTLYNAAANAGMTIIERHDHSMPVPYIETGKDAATSYGGIDFKFKNNQDFPVMISSQADNGDLSVTISAI